ncbi:MAG: type II secretion system inner membrane protein GspF [Betaproteobacteria bacterium]|nr:type II secretion system inner membrane protein GspF [Betaproteobacteria bacterium]MDE2131824.1 type II secretion system inner membrane protein GspF [Betaproteobacteria bacterium]MDE2212091.1 type II secretion system inner membrane protein GspF [Betaproteobacteria bacterium]
MPVFRFEAMDQAGQSESGVIEAESPRQARSLLRARGLVPLSLMTAKEMKGRQELSLFRRGLSGGDRVTVIRQLSSLLNAGIPLDEALGAVASDAERPAVRERTLELRSEVLGGSPLASAMAMHPKDFPPIYQALVAAGEKSGRLGWVLERLADYAQARDALQQKVLMALAYPAIVMVVAFGIVIFLMTTVVPQVVAVFVSSHQALPFLTRAMIFLSDLVRNWGWLAALLLLGLVWLVRRAWKIPAVRLRWDERTLTWPVVGKLVRGYNTERFASTLSILVGGGVPILLALQGAADTLANTALRRDVEEAIVRVREGSGLARALGRDHRFPPILLQLIHSGETTGKLPEMLERAAQGEGSALERRILLFTTLLEPILILLMGAVVATIVMAVLLPILEINQMVR